MEIFCIIVIFLMFGIAMYFILRSQFQKLYEQKYNEKYEELLKNGKEEIRKEAIKESQEILSNLEELKEKANSKEAEVYRLDRSIKEKTEFNSSLQKIREEELDKLIEKEKEKRLLQLEHDVEEWAESAQDCANFQFEEIMSNYQTELDGKSNELYNLCLEVNEYKEKRDAINAEILRSRALNEQQDFYRIQIEEKDKEDINYLISIITRFNNKETIYKLIWIEYLQKPFKLMLNRVLGGKDPKNVIYMIKNLNTQEIYIGKTKSNVSKRWTEHIKTSLNIGTISRSNIHKALFNHWDEYSFSIIEEVKNEDKLSERERYYINFYESNIYGYNIKSGG